MRIEERDPDEWFATWTFPIDEARASRAGYGDNTTIVGSLDIDYPFRGCPHCEANSFVACGVCFGISCWVHGARWWTCQWCEAEGEPSGRLTTFRPNSDA